MTTSTATTLTQLNPDSRPYMPRGASLELFDCRAGEVLISGPAGTGKSRSVLEKLNAAAMKYPNMRGLITRKTRASLSESVLQTFEDHVIPVGSPIIRGAHRSHRTDYRYPNGSILVVVGLDSSERIMSSEYDMICAFEATEIHESDWERMLTRLRNGRMPYQQGICDCNPNAPTHWVKQRADAGVMTHLVSRHEDNPRLWSGTDWTEEGGRYIATLDALTGLRHERLRLGKWVGAEGCVYPDFDARIHVVDRFDLPHEWRRIRAIDFGFVNPFVCQWWAIDGDGRMYLYREIYRTQRLVEDHAKMINTLSAGERIVGTISDHDAEGRATLHRRGISADLACKWQDLGIQTVQARLRVQGDGKPRLTIFRDALVERDPTLSRDRKPLCTAQEMPLYVWAKPKADGQMREAPMDLNDHGCDALRYAVMYVDAGAARPLRVNRIIDNSGPAFSHPRYAAQVAQFYGQEWHSDLLRDMYR